MKRWWLTVVLAAVVIGLAVWLAFPEDRAGRLVSAYADDPTLAAQVVHLGPEAVAPLCEALERLPASGLTEAQGRAMINYVVALDAIAAGWPYTTGQSMPVLLRTLQRLEDDSSRRLLMDTVGRAFKQSAVSPMLDVMEDEYRLVTSDAAAPLPSEPAVAELLRRMGAARCLPVLEARLQATATDFRRPLVRMVVVFAPDEQVGAVLARALAEEQDAERRAWLEQTIAGLPDKAKPAARDEAAEGSTP